MSVVKHQVGWCRVCQSQHPSDPCPGYVQLTGPECPSRRFAARRDGRVEHYRTLVAQAGERWQARIVTVPNRIWSVPGGSGTAKFLGASADEAESKAVLFLYTRCASANVEVKELQTADSPSSPSLADGKGCKQELPALFGPERPMWPAKALNLSRGSLYLATAHIERVCTPVVIKMQLEHFHTPLVGVVAWVNPTATETEPVGMGVTLEEPPFAYCRYVDALEHAPVG